jgi:hypothetical protein
MKKYKRSSLLAAKCPNCGSRNTKIDWTNIDNYRRVLLTIIVAIAGTYARGWDRVCLDCRQKFAP